MIILFCFLWLHVCELPCKQKYYKLIGFKTEKLFWFSLKKMLSAWHVCRDLNACVNVRYRFGVLISILWYVSKRNVFLLFCSVLTLQSATTSICFAFPSLFFCSDCCSVVFFLVSHLLIAWGLSVGFLLFSFVPLSLPLANILVNCMSRYAWSSFIFYKFLSLAFCSSDQGLLIFLLFPVGISGFIFFPFDVWSCVVFASSVPEELEGCRRSIFRLLSFGFIVSLIYNQSHSNRIFSFHFILFSVISPPVYNWRGNGHGAHQKHDAEVELTQLEHA